MRVFCIHTQRREQPPAAGLDADKGRAGGRYGNHHHFTGKESETMSEKRNNLERFNLGLTSENLQYVRVMAKVTGVAATRYIDNLITKEREANKDKYKRAQEFIRDVNES